MREQDCGLLVCYGLGCNDEWPPVVFNGFTGVITKDEGIYY